MKQVLLCLALSGCVCAPKATTISTVGTALQQPDYHAAVDGLLAGLGRELVCALEKIAAGALEQAATADHRRERAVEWLKSHGYKVLSEPR
jgi:hypothetical protein